MKNKLSPTSLIIHFFFFSTFLFPQVESPIENNIKLMYARTESRDVLRVGDKLGSRIILYFDGRIEKYSIVYGTDEILLSVNRLNQNEIKNIDRIFSNYNFLEYPEKIPYIKAPMWPSSSTQIKYALNGNDELKSIIVSSNSDRKFIPSNYYEFIREIKETLFSYF
ncbi:MAG: hypothetical protein OQJ93_08635 [Ignavibacteriaceae bacterium]|jgi:hypothetical protein|nr:hypothetical protein [Ignavibacteriaceae bacterium]MCW8813100.1 hypothetical protein [Chlorobium sp.]MCW8996044.1 hypothetical protein [Psychromonas sp.]MCW8818064.1 hypothetical protein [Ignavibacteriaceae bacterium]MCW8824240.1 hypothetical protein [Ignavibacteriaceae bacterium]